MVCTLSHEMQPVTNMVNICKNTILMMVHGKHYRNIPEHKQCPLIYNLISQQMLTYPRDSSFLKATLYPFILTAYIGLSIYGLYSVPYNLHITNQSGVLNAI